MTALPPPSKHSEAAAGLPHEEELEQELLGSLMFANRSIEAVAGILAVEDFYAEVHRRIFDAMLKLNARGEAVTVPTLAKYFRKDELMAQIGGLKYLAQLAALGRAAAPATEYAKAIKRTAGQRRVLAVNARTAEILANPRVDEDYDADIAELRDALDQAMASSQTRVKPRDLNELAQLALQQADRAYKGERVGIPTGIGDLDQIFGGFAPKQLTLLAARPSMGKSALALQISLNAAYQGHSVLFFSLEMSGEEFGERALSNWSGVPYSDMSTGRLSDKSFTKMLAARNRAATDGNKLKFRVQDIAGLTVAQIKRECRMWKRQHGLDLVVVDHLGLLRPERPSQRRTEDVSEISGSLKALAMDLGVPVLALSQLNRDLERREDKRPMLADLRDSGSLEQDADTVMFVFREEYYLELSKPAENDPDFAEWQTKMEANRGLCEVILAKQRRGRKGKAAIWFEPATNRFDDLSKRDNHHDPRQEGFEL